VDAPSYRLNAMQALMRRFADLAPYNFIHVMRVAGAARVDRWREAATHALAELCLGAPHFDGDRVSFAAAAPTVLETPQHSLDHHLDAELNRPFLPGDAPVRFFVIEEADDSHWFGIVLDHWIADDHSCRQLMQRIFLRYHAPDKATALPPLRFADASKTGVVLPALRSLPTLFRQLADHRQAFRVSLGDPEDFAVRTFHHRLPDGLIQTIQQRAKARGATVHDFFLAACAQACGEFRRGHGQGSRTAVSLATVADLRRYLGFEADSETTFGCLLSYYTSTISRPEDAPAAELLPAIAAGTGRSKKILRTTAATLHLARFWWDRSRSARGKATLFQRSLPNVCGLSNVNLIGSWIDQAGPVLRDYRRVGPAGPIAPLIFMLTSIADRLTVEVTYRTTAFTREDAERMTDQFSQFLQALSH
jgi:NRPS condensation-like uncharacterized protein